jgi:large repetitive protein
LGDYDIGPNDPLLGVLSPWSDPAHTCSAPSAPSGAVAAAGDGSASVSWAAPASDGNSPITSYTVTASPGGQSATTSGQTTATVNGLTNGSASTFTVTATNAAGTSAASAATAAVTPKAGNTAASGFASGLSQTTVSTGQNPAVSGGIASSLSVPAGTGGGGVTITQTAASLTAPAGYLFGGVQVDITAPAATATNPLALTFTLTPPAGQAPPPDVDTLAASEIYRAESGAPVLVPDCPVAGQALPDGSACVASRQYAGSNIQLTVLSASASHWVNARAKPGAVSVSDSAYTPANVTVQPGAPVTWTWSGKKAHSVTDSVGLGASGQPWFNSGVKTGTGTYRFSFPAAGMFAYSSTVKGDSRTGSVIVPVAVTPASGPRTATYSVIWSTRTLAGYTFTVQYRFKPAGSNKWTNYTSWQNAVTATSARFTPNQGAGSYAFRAQLRNSASGRTSAFSPDVTLSVT